MFYAVGFVYNEYAQMTVFETENALHGTENQGIILNICNIA